MDLDQDLGRLPAVYRGMDSTGSTSGTTGSTGGSLTGTTGTTSGTTGSLPVGWVRVADLADELGRSPRWLREWLSANVPNHLQERVRRPSGGAPERWAAPEAVDLLRRHFSNGSTGGSPPEPPEPPEAPEPTADGWRAAVEAERGRAAAAEALADRFRHELDVLRAMVDRLETRADEADRGRHAAELRLAEVRTAVWAWVAQIRGLAWWRRLHRLPDPPAALVAQERLLAKPEG